LPAFTNRSTVSVDTKARADQKRARVFGVLYLITFVTSIPALRFTSLSSTIPSATSHAPRILLAALLELLLIIANIGTAVVIFPIVRRKNEELALGYVTARMIEMHLHPRGHRLRARHHHPAEPGRRRG
jgi:hypothetical protein